jgi:hypothetical protein
MTKDQSSAAYTSDLAKRFFEGMRGSDKLQSAVQQADERVQFIPLAGPAFFVEFRRGHIEFGVGEKYGSDLHEAIHIIEVQEALTPILNGDDTLGEAIFYQKLRIPGYRNKEPRLAALSLILRRGVWGTVKAPRILMPTK